MATKKKKEQDVQTVSLSAVDNATGESVIQLRMTTKEVILLHLWSYSGNAPNEKTRAEIMEIHEVLKKGLVNINVRDIDKEKGTFVMNLSRRPTYSAEVLDKYISTFWVGLAIAELYGFKKEFLEANKYQEAQQQRPQLVKTGKHLVAQFLGPVDPQTKLNFAETLERYTQETGLTMGNRPLGFGLDLNIAQQRVTHAILEAFSRDEYQGQITLPKEEVLTDPERGPNLSRAKLLATGPGALYRKAYSSIPHLPTIRLTLAEVVKLAGYEHGRQGDKQKVTEAIAHLRSHLYLFWWRRKAFTIKNGVAIPERDAKGEHKWEEREDLSPLFRIVYVRDEQTKELKYYEISPSAVVLDQVSPVYGGNYFLMVPQDLHTQIQKAVGKGKKSSSYTFAFLMYLLSEYERYRSHAKKGAVPKVLIAKPWEEIAQRIKMPESRWKRKRRETEADLERLYQVAKELGYLKAYRRGADGGHTLELEASKYYRPEKELQEGK